MPYVVSPKSQPKPDQDHTFGQRTATTTTHDLITPSDIATIDHTINRSYPFRSRNHIDANTVAADAHIDVTISTLTSSNSNLLFIPASTSKYPIKQSTIAEDLSERFNNFVEHWSKTVYLARKSIRK